MTTLPLRRALTLVAVALACDARESTPAADARATASPPPASAPVADAKPVAPAVKASPPGSPIPQPPATPLVVVAKDETIAELTPETVVALQSSEPAAKWKALGDDTYERVGDDSLQLAFAVHAFELAGKPHRFAMWAFGDGSGAYHGALFDDVQGRFRPLWVKRSLIVEPDPPDEVRLPWILDLGSEHAVIVFVPASIGCGGEDCRPEDDFVDTRFLEITAQGVVELVEIHGPGCVPAADRHPVAPDQCLVRTEAKASADEVPDLVIEILGKKKRTRRFTYQDDRLVEVRRGSGR